jgi:serpin B
MGEMNAEAGSKSGNSETTVPKGSELKPASQAKAGVSGHRQQSASQKAVVKAVNGFAGQTFGQLLQTNDKNVVISPLGLGTALNLLAAGAGSETVKLLRAGLGPNGLSEGDTLTGLKALTAEVAAASSDQVILRSANAVWIGRGSNPSPEFEKRALDIFSADVQAVDLQSPETVELINQWARQKTDGLVTAAVDRLDPTTRFVLTNAVYFKGTWLTAFDPAKTQPAPFTTVSGAVREVSMMESSFPVRYAAQSDADPVRTRVIAPPSQLPHGLHAIWLPYQGERVQMLIVAPTEQAPVDSVKKALQKMPLTDLVRSLDRDQSKMLVRVKVPRFTAQFAADVSSTLAQQGLAQPFSAATDYRAISSGQGIISVLHRAVLEVNEKGTTAAATTAVTSDRGLTDEPPIFSADKPFLVAIIDRETGATLFAGYIAGLGDDQPQSSTKTGSQ